MEAGVFIAQCESRGIAIFLKPSGEIDATGPQELLTDRFRSILRDYAGLLKPVLSVPVDAVKLAADDGFGATEDVESPAPAIVPVNPHSGVQLVWEEGKRIKWMVVCWIGKSEDRYSSGAGFGQYGFGETKVSALRSLLATLCNIGHPNDLRRIVGRVYAELESLEDDSPMPNTLDLATTDHGLPPVFEWKEERNKRWMLSVRFNDGCYLEAKGADRVTTWETLRRHPGAAPEQQWWLLKANPLSVFEEGGK